MLQIALAGVFVILAVVAIGGRGLHGSSLATQYQVSLLDETSDLPCPWCRSQTREGDVHCGSCGQRFG